MSRKRDPVTLPPSTETRDRTRNVVSELLLHAQEHPNAPALLLADRTVEYGRLARWVGQAAQYLRSSGVSEQLVVGLSFRDDASKIVALLAVGWLGATAYSIPANAGALRRSEMTRVAGVDLVLSDLPPEAATWETKVVPFSRDHVPEEGWGVTEPPAIVSHPHGPLFIITGSGSTGNPKRIPVTHAQVRERLRTEKQRLGLTAQDRIGDFSRLDFADPKHWLWDSLMVGAAFVPASAVISRLRAGDMTMLTLTVYFVERLLQPGAASLWPALRRLRVFCVGSATVSGDLRRRIKTALCPRLYVDYGSNEAGLVSILTPDEAAHPGSVGRPLPGVEIQIVDDRARVLPPDRVGHVRCRSPAVFDGYLNDEGANQQVFRDGWFYLGDLGFFDQAGHLIFAGRADDMMIRDGINIYPAEIEQVMSWHQAVQDVVAFPARHPVHQAVPLCAVALRDRDAATEESLQQFAAERLGERAPARVVVLERIPRNQQGKIQRARLHRTVNRAIDPASEQRDHAVQLEDSGHLVRIGGRLYPRIDLSRDARMQLANVEAADREIERLIQRLDIARTARATYARALREELSKDRH